MDVKKIVTQLQTQYPQASIILNPLDHPTEILCEVEPSAKHPEYSKAIAIIDSSSPHFHRRTTETYTVLKGALTVYVDDVIYELSEGESLKIAPNQLHWATGNETWIECVSKPGWQFTDHVMIKPRQV